MAERLTVLPACLYEVSKECPKYGKLSSRGHEIAYMWKGCDTQLASLMAQGERFWTLTCA